MHSEPTPSIDSPFASTAETPALEDASFEEIETSDATPIATELEGSTASEELAADSPQESITTTLSPEPEEEPLPLKAQIEAVLFLTGKPLPIDLLAEQVQATLEATEDALVELIQDYAYRIDTALEIDDSEEGYILQVRPELQGIVEKMLPIDLSASALRTLSIIAIKAPILQKDLIEIRGSGAYDAIHELRHHQLVSKKREGRSYMLNVTPKFHQLFKLEGDKKDLQWLVDLEEDKRTANETHA